MSDPNGRTHEPDIRELTAQLDGLRELLEERDRRYCERFKAQDDKTILALTSAKEAVGKAEAATERRFESVNEFRATLSDQARDLMPRKEADQRFQALADRIEVLKKAADEQRDQMRRDIAALQLAQSAGAGAKTQTQTSQASLHLLMSGLALVLAFGAAAVSVVLFLVGRQP